MSRFITISKTALQKHPEAGARLLQLAQKVNEIGDVNIYVSQNSAQLIEFICYLKDSDIPFSFFSNEEELNSKFSLKPRVKS